MSKHFFTDLVIVVNAVVIVLEIYTGNYISALIFGLNASVLFQFRVSKDKR